VQRRPPCGLALAEQQQTLFAGSATECTACAQHRELPVIRSRRNFATAMPALASSAAQIAFGASFGQTTLGPVPRSPRCAEQLGRTLGDQPDRPVVGRTPTPRAPRSSVYRGDLACTTARTLGAEQDLRAVVARRSVDLVAEMVAVDHSTDTANSGAGCCTRVQFRPGDFGMRPRPARREVEHPQQFRHVNVFRGEAAAQHVVGVGHYLDATPCR
jgi:hypothetical protein